MNTLLNKKTLLIKKMQLVKKSLVATAILSTMTFSQISHAGGHQQDEQVGFDSAQETQNNLVGMGGMAIVGAAVGGPIGAAVGGVLGLMLGEDVNNDKRTETLQARVNNKEQELNTIEAQYLALQNEHMTTIVALKQLKEQQKQVQVASLTKEVAPVDLTDLLSSEANIQFKTASYQLEQHYVEQLDIVAEQLKSDSKLVVQLFGYADRRGDENYNLSLSEKRADQVQRYLVSKGVNKSQIESAGYGEALPVTVNQTWENDFFDRRVVVRFTSENAVMTAKQ